VTSIPILLLVVVAGYLARRWWRRLSMPERSVATRGGLALLLINLAVILGVVFLPGRFKLFALVPGVLTIGSTVKLLRDARQRVRSQVAEESRFARAKRIN
jgi:hypothetical protein